MTIIEVSAQFGGLDATQAILPHFHALKRAHAGRSFVGFPLPKLGFILRVDGQLQSFGRSGVDNLKFDRKLQWVSVDIVITSAEWLGRETSDVSDFVAGTIMASIVLMKERGGRRLDGTDWHAVETALQEFSAAYREEARGISDEP